MKVGQMLVANHVQHKKARELSDQRGAGGFGLNVRDIP